jgi:hypothetical protein
LAKAFKKVSETRSTRSKVYFGVQKRWLPPKNAPPSIILQPSSKYLLQIWASNIFLGTISVCSWLNVNRAAHFNFDRIDEPSSHSNLTSIKNITSTTPSTAKPFPFFHFHQANQIIKNESSCHHRRCPHHDRLGLGRHECLRRRSHERCAKPNNFVGSSSSCSCSCSCREGVRSEHNEQPNRTSSSSKCSESEFEQQQMESLGLGRWLELGSFTY